VSVLPGYESSDAIPLLTPKSRILFVLAEDNYIRNYLRSGVVEELSTAYDISLIIDERLGLRDEAEKSRWFRGTYQIAKTSEKKHLLLSQLLMWRNRKKSRTFLYRWLRISRWPAFAPGLGRHRTVLRYVRWLTGLLRNWEALRIPLLGSGVLGLLCIGYLKKTLAVSPDLARLITASDADVVIFPSSAYEAAGVDVVRICRAANIASLALIDNWDNLSSKTVFWSRPDFIGVWGEQTALQAIQIHGFRRDQVELLGTPRFDQYFDNRRGAITSHYPFPYILFVGSAMPFDELSALKILEDSIREARGQPAGLKVVYRPHPWQQKRAVPADFDPADFDFTVLDTQINSRESPHGSGDRERMLFQPDLAYYPSLLRNALCVTGPLTTMLFEAALCLRPVVALAYSDGHHSNTSQRYFSHFAGLENVPGFSFAESPSEIAPAIHAALTHPRIEPKDSDAVTAGYLFRSDTSYPKRLKQFVDSVIAAKHGH